MFLMQDAGRAPDDNFWYEPIGIANSSGANVSPATALKLTTIYACVKVISETVAQLPLHLYRDAAGGGKEKATDHPLYNVLHTRPNNYQTSFEWREMMQTHVLIKGNAYSEMIFSGYQVSELIPLHPDHVTPVPLDNGSYRYDYKDPQTNQVRAINRYSMLHLRGQSFGGLLGLNPIELQAEAIGLGLSMQEYNARFIKNDTRTSSWIEYNGSFKDIEAKRRFRQSWEESQAGGRINKTAVLEHGMKYNQVQVNNRDVQFIEARVNSEKEMARIFRMPPHKVGIMDDATFSNIEQQSTEFVVDTMMPWLVRWEQVLMRDVILEDDGIFPKFSVDGLLRGDSTARSAYYASGITSGWLAPNEARELEDRNPIEGLDKPLKQMNMATVGEDTEDPAEESEDIPDPNAARMVEIKRNAAARVVNKETLALGKEYAKAMKAADIDGFTAGVEKTYNQKHVYYVMTHMVISKQSAENYVNESKSAIFAAMNTEIANSEPAITALIDEWQLNKADTLSELE